MKTMNLTEARGRLLRIANELERDPDAIVEVTKRGRRIMTLVPAERWDALVETLEILADEATMTAIRRGRAQIAAGRGIPWAVARKKLGLD